MDPKIDTYLDADYDHDTGTVTIRKLRYKGEILVSDRLVLHLPLKDATWLVQSINAAIDIGWELRKRVRRKV
jgi:hypothetical protein